MPAFTAVVPTTGERVDLTFAGSVPSLVATDFFVVANGVVMELGTPTGSGTAWSLPLTAKSAWIPLGYTVKISRVSDLFSATATNNSIRTALQKRYVERGFGIFLHFASWTFGAVTWPPTLPDIAAIEMPDYDMEQWFTDVIVPSGARYAVLTTKHHDAFCLWPTATGCWNIAQTAYAVAHPEADLVRDYVRLCRKYGIGVGIYYSVYDLWWELQRPGHDTTYTDDAFIAYTQAQITELFSNYGKIDIFWIDGHHWHVSYTDLPYSDITSVRDALQPDCLIMDNVHEANLDHTDIVGYEGSGGGETIPASSNTVPSEFTEDARASDHWGWLPVGYTPPWMPAGGNNDSYKDVYSVALKVQQSKAARTSYLLNFPPNDEGLMPDSSVTYVATMGAIIGEQGGPAYPALPDVRAGVDRGDGQTGSFGGGINSSAILGVV